MTFNIILTISEWDDGYCDSYWFAGGMETLGNAERAATVEEADRILRLAYLGPDVDGVEVSWEISR